MKITNINGISVIFVSVLVGLSTGKYFLVRAYQVFVQKFGCSDKDGYIIPMCELHNKQKGKMLTVSDFIYLVSAKVSKTCG